MLYRCSKREKKNPLEMDIELGKTLLKPENFFQKKLNKILEL